MDCGFVYKVVNMFYFRSFLNLEGVDILVIKQCNVSCKIGEALIKEALDTIHNGYSTVYNCYKIDTFLVHSRRELLFW